MTLAGPELSVNKLAEYMCSRAARQRKILHERKYPDPEFQIGMFHREAREAITSYLSSGAIDPGIITARSQLLGQLTPEKIGTARRINANIDALERFGDMLDDIDLENANPEMGGHAPPKLTYHNVKISVRPDIILRGVGPKQQSLVGAIKINFSKTHCHTEESAGYVSAAVQEYVRLHIAGADEIVAPHYCKVICVGSGAVFNGVKATKKRLADIASECQNIAALWASI